MNDENAQETIDVEAHTPQMELIRDMAGVGIKIIQDESLRKRARLNIVRSIFKDIQREFGGDEEYGTGGAACIECTLHLSSCTKPRGQCLADYTACKKLYCS